MQKSQIANKPKIRIVVFASGWNSKQEYDNKLVKALQSKYDIDVISYDNNKNTIKNTINTKMSHDTEHHYTVGGNTDVKRKVKDLLNETEAQKVKKELNDNASQYKHTVYINGFGSARGEVHTLKDILTEEKGRTCLNWCTCCQPPQKYSQKPIVNACNSYPVFPSNKYKDLIKYDDKKNTYQYLVKGIIAEEDDITPEQRGLVNNIIKNKELNADFSQELVDKIVDNIAAIDHGEHDLLQEFLNFKLDDNQDQLNRSWSILDIQNDLFNCKQNQSNISAIDHGEHDLLQEFLNVKLDDNQNQLNRSWSMDI